MCFELLPVISYARIVKAFETISTIVIDENRNFPDVVLGVEGTRDDLPLVSVLLSHHRLMSDVIPFQKFFHLRRTICRCDLRDCLRLGFSAHNAPAALRLMDALELDSVLFPVNVNAWENGGFGPQILAKAKSKGMARMALKALAFGQWPADMKPSDRKYPKCWYQPIDDREMARLALRFTLNQEITAAVPPGDERIFDLALELASMPLPQLSADELTGLKAKVSSLDPVFRA